MFILMVVVLIAGNVQSITTQEFSTKQKCEFANVQLIGAVAETKSKLNFESFCVEK